MVPIIPKDVVKLTDAAVVVEETTVVVVVVVTVVIISSPFIVMYKHYK